MTVLDEILEWSSSLPEAWLRDALRRLVVQQSLAAADLDEVFELFKFEAGLRKDAPEKAAVPLEACHLPNRTVGGSVAITRIGPVFGVNALAAGETIDLEPRGLNIVYGRNASGKSGYSRVLKKACRARDSEERLLGNVFSQSPEVDQRAEFTLLVGSRQETVTWTPENAPDETASVAVFDSRCARLYLDKAGDVACMPYGMDVLQDLCDAMDELGSRLDRERDEIELPDLPVIASGTAAKAFTDSLNARTTDDQIEGSCKFDDKAAERLEELRQLLAKDPENEAKRLRRLAERLRSLNLAIVGLRNALVGEPSRLATLQKAVDSAREAVGAASTLTFNDCLPGIGSDPWRSLFAAAEKYSVSEAYKGEEFPVIGDEARCVLCHQPLTDDAKERFIRFKQFIGNEAGQTLDRCEQAVGGEMTALVVHIGTLAAVDDALVEEVGEVNKPLSEALADLRKRCGGYAAAEAPSPDDIDTGIGPLATGIPDPDALAAVLEANAAEILSRSDAEEKRKLDDEIRELEARKVLASSKASVTKRRNRLAEWAAIERAKKQLHTRRITEASKRIAASAITDDLAEAWDETARTLGITNDSVVMKNSPGKGCFKSKMELEGCLTKAGPQEVLSEGEQRVIAVAAFMAELSLAEDANAVVFDDPVSSLDHNYRERVARSIVNLATSRQVIVFTHDLVFLHDLAGYCEDTGTDCTVRGIHRGGAGEVGKCGADSCPGELLPLGEHLDRLNTDYGNLQREHADNGESPDYLKGVNEWYELLRKAWERAVEEKLLNKVVQSFCDDVKMMSLREVAVDDDDWAYVLAGMSACSTHVHRMSAARNAPPPTPDVLRGDLDHLIEFKTRVEGRRRLLRNSRPKA